MALGRAVELGAGVVTEGATAAAGCAVDRVGSVEVDTD